MTGNAPDALTVRLPHALLTGDEAPCDVCGGQLPDHDWADLDPDGTVVNCSSVSS